MLQNVGPGRPAFDYAWRGADLLNLREICLEWLRHCDHLDAHLHGQRVCGNVVWPLGWSAGIFAQVRIDLLLHHRFGKCTERLSYANDVGSFWILHAVRRETRCWNKVRGIVHIGSRLSLRISSPSAGLLLRSVRTSFCTNRASDLVVRGLRNDVLLNQLALGPIRPPVDHFLCVSIANSWKRHQFYFRGGIDID